MDTYSVLLDSSQLSPVGALQDVQLAPNFMYYTY